MKKFVAWFAENHVAANLLMIFVLVAGAVTGATMKLEIFPEISMDQISITTEYIGASPAEVEEAIIRRIEENIAGLAGIKRIDSSAREGYGTVIIEVMKDWDLKTLLDEVKAEVDRITTFPKEAEKPLVKEVTHRHEVLNVAVYGDAPEATLKELAEKVKNDITNLPGITLAQVAGVREGEIHIEISENTLRQYGLTLGRVADMVGRASLDLPAGDIKTNAGEILVRTKGRRYFASDYRDVAVITKPDGSKVTLGEIASLTDGFEDVDFLALYRGKPAAMVQVFRVADQNALNVADTVKKYVEDMRPTLPEGVGLDYFADRSTILRSRITLLLKNMTLGLILVGILLGLFLNLRLAFWVTLGIPISFATGLWLLPRFDVSMNMISLFAFIMVLGIVVDDAIVIGENIFRKQEEGFDRVTASVEGTIEVGRPVIFAVLTTMAAFWPLLMGSGSMGKVVRAIPLVVIVVLLGSLMESLMILPAHLNRSGKKTPQVKTKINGKNHAATRLKRFIDGPYSRTLAFFIKWRYAMVAVGISLILWTVGLWQGGWLKFTFMPKVESDFLTCSLTMPVGTSIERTKEMVAYLEQSAKEALAEADKERPEDAPPLYQTSSSYAGFNFSGGMRSPPKVGGHLGQIFIQLLEGEKRDQSAARLNALWREKAGPLPEVESVIFQSELFSMGNAIEIHLSLDDHDQLVAAADALEEELAGYPGVFDINDSFQPGKDEMQLKLKPAARSLGLTLSDLAQQVRHAFYGAEALRLQRDQDEVKVLVRYPESERKSLGNIEQMRIRTFDGFEVPFNQVALTKIEQGYSTIERAQRRRVIKVAANVDEAVTNANEVRMELESNFLPQLINQYPGLRYTLEGEGKEQKESMQDVFRGFAIAILAIYALLAVPFRSFTQPFIVISAIPFGIVGALLGHLIMGYNLSMMSLFGIVGAAGVVVNDSLVLIHATNRFRAEGLHPIDAIKQAGPLRFRAIILTSLTTFAGLTPMLLERSMQAQFLIPMAISLAFGVLFATWVTLLLIPCGYVIMDDIRVFLGGLKEKFFGVTVGA